LAEARPFCQIEADGTVDHIAFVGFPAAGEMLIGWSRTATELWIRLEGPHLHWRLNVAGQDHQAGRVCFPFLAALRVGHDSQAPEPAWLSEGSFHDSRGRPIFRHVNWPLPLVKVGPAGRTLTLLAGRGVQPPLFRPEIVESAPGLPCNPGAEPQTGLEMELILHDGGWPVAFDLFRRRVRARFDLSQYQRPDLAWYDDQFVQHFTFLYGREILNLETGGFELDRFLDEGERDFGGYDGFLIWGVYPRIGVNERTQWEFYDDFPGGREGLRAMARRARERGVRFFIPYKPWDR
jgi:hypothetical protein